MDNTSTKNPRRRLPRFLHSTGTSIGQIINLSKSSSHHAKNVLRLKAGDSVRIFDGRGKEFEGEIVRTDETFVEVLTHYKVDSSPESSLEVILAQGLSRSDRMDFTIQKSVELGVNRIFPLFTDRSQIQLSGDRIDRKLKHWKNLIDAACEQCLRNVRPSISKPIDLKQWLGDIGKTKNDNWHKVVLDPTASKSLKSLDNPKKIILLVGPESGFTDQELVLATNANFRLIRLGPRVLRTETAGLAGVAIIQAIWGDL